MVNHRTRQRSTRPCNGQATDLALVSRTHDNIPCPWHPLVVSRGVDSEYADTRSDVDHQVWIWVPEVVGPFLIIVHIIQLAGIGIEVALTGQAVSVYVVNAFDQAVQLVKLPQVHAQVLE